MDPNYEGNSFTDVDFKPGADFEVDDTLFQVLFHVMFIHLVTFF